ncbi:MAG: GGDEF domain-containing protein, partial [Arenimonas sp.]
LNSTQAAVFSEKIRAAVENENIAHVGSSHGRLTISSGVASIRPRAGTNPELIIAEADAALYLAKNNGKNRVEQSQK